MSGVGDVIRIQDWQFELDAALPLHIKFPTI